MSVLYFRNPTDGRFYPIFAAASAGNLDHGDLQGLDDDDHPQYLNEIRGDVIYRRLDVQIAHDTLSGLADDDHPQYLNEARADLLYDPIDAASDAVSAHVAASDPHTTYWKAWVGTQAQYDALGSYDSRVLYVVTD